jgi:tRNA (guanine-N7-)-methyltransferase
VAAEAFYEPEPKLSCGTSVSRLPALGQSLDANAVSVEKQTMRVFDPQRIPKPRAPTPLWPLLRDPIDLELGAGAGLHAIRHAQAHPDRFLIAIERTSKALRLLSRAERHPDVKNLLAVRADAIHWVAQEVPENSIERCFILYPNPYPKHKQRNLRWHNMPFMGFLISRLKPLGQIVMATNKEDYASEAMDVMVNHWGLTPTEHRRLSSEEKPRTHFEKKYLSRSEPCWNLIFSRPVSH